MKKTDTDGYIVSFTPSSEIVKKTDKVDDKIFFLFKFQPKTS